MEPKEFDMYHEYNKSVTTSLLDDFFKSISIEEFKTVEEMLNTTVLSPEERKQQLLDFLATQNVEVLEMVVEAIQTYKG